MPYSKEIHLVFNETEMTEFLSKRGYTTELVKGWVSDNDHYNRPGFRDSETLISYKEKDDKLTELILSEDLFRLKYYYDIGLVFKAELHKALLNL